MAELFDLVGVQLFEAYRVEAQPVEAITKQRGPERGKFEHQAVILHRKASLSVPDIQCLPPFDSCAV